MIIKVLVAIAVLLLMAVGTYLIHWLLNAKEWTEYYIKKSKSDLSTKAPKGSKRHKLKTTLKKRKVVAKTVDLRSRVIEFLAKDKPTLAPVFIYIIMGAFLVLVLLAIITLADYWLQLP